MTINGTWIMNHELASGGYITSNIITVFPLEILYFPLKVRVHYHDHWCFYNSIYIYYETNQYIIFSINLIKIII